jgi:hypothetical protein
MIGEGGAAKAAPPIPFAIRSNNTSDRESESAAGTGLSRRG